FWYSNCWMEKEMNDMWTALIGLFGVLLGMGLNELLRRRNRIETYSSIVFDKRLALYEELMSRLQAAYKVATDVMENEEYSEEQRQELVSAAILDIAAFSDENELYIDSDLAAHCVATFMGAEDIQGIQD